MNEFWMNYIYKIEIMFEYIQISEYKNKWQYIEININVSA